MNIPNIAIPEAEVSAFCKRWLVTELALFGSVLRDVPDSVGGRRTLRHQ